jgi:hypothetical protein
VPATGGPGSHQLISEETAETCRPIWLTALLSVGNAERVRGDFVEPPLSVLRQYSERRENHTQTCASASERRHFVPPTTLTIRLKGERLRTAEGDSAAASAWPVFARWSRPMKELRPYALGSLATARGVGGSLPELGRVRVRR